MRHPRNERPSAANWIAFRTENQYGTFVNALVCILDPRTLRPFRAQMLLFLAAGVLRVRRDRLPPAKVTAR